MDRRVFLKNAVGVSALACLGPFLGGCRKETFYTSVDFLKIPKTDVHFHYDTPDDTFLKYARSMGMHLVSVNVDAGEPLEDQLDITFSLTRKYPGAIDFLGTFPVDDFGKDDFVEKTIACIDKCMNAGAKGIKIWKNIGMTLQDTTGAYVMVDHPAYTPVFSYLEKQGIPLMAHLGEPKNCWLPYEKMTMMSDLRYYQRHPEFHMFQHPDMPSYEAQIAARDHLLEMHPKLVFVGAHIGSLEWDVDEVARRFDKYPCFFIDLSARMGYMQYQSYQDKTKIHAFLTKYQDRILYGSDTTINPENTADPEKRCNTLHDTWLSHWTFLATNESVAANSFNMENAPKEVSGLQLSKTVVDKIFFGNTKQVFKIG